ncbi:hypothetical protein [Citrobacter koseri]|nr:hypothetical protein [Citrobacter koseri]
MPTKHINDVQWRKIEKETVRAVSTLAVPVKDTKMLEWIIAKGLETITEDDYRKFLKTESKKKSREKIRETVLKFGCHRTRTASRRKNEQQQSLRNRN